MRCFAALLLLILVSAAGCGQKGPLYLPQTTTEASSSEDGSDPKRKKSETEAKQQ